MQNGGESTDNDTNTLDVPDATNLVDLAEYNRQSGRIQAGLTLSTQKPCSHSPHLATLL
jgi:hypothetical protein